MSLNPALEDVRFCPRCAAEATIDFPRRLRCGACGFVAFYNPKPVAAAVPRDDAGRIWLLRRAFEPGQGRWTFPGGFVDLGESVEDAARRETMEEMRVALQLDGLVGVYSRAEDRVVLVVFHARLAAGDTPGTSEEATEVQPFAPHDIPWDELAFWSTERALRDLLDSGRPAGRLRPVVGGLTPPGSARPPAPPPPRRPRRPAAPTAARRGTRGRPRRPARRPATTPRGPRPAGPRRR